MKAHLEGDFTLEVLLFNIEIIQSLVCAYAFVPQ